MKRSAPEAFDRACQIIKRLRAPDGCPWDREQTPASMRANLIEEAYECVEAINDDDRPHVREELGDVFLLAIFIGTMYEESGDFSVADSLDELSEKLIRRHPHVFGDAAAADSAEVLRQWEVIKETVEGRAKKDSVLDEVSTALPPLERAYKMQKKAAKTGFDWREPGEVWGKLAEELEECREACAEADAAHLEEELGDLLFSAINVARFLKVDPAVALQRTVTKFDRRFRHVERRMRAEGRTMDAAAFDRMDALWDEAKAIERSPK